MNSIVIFVKYPAPGKVKTRLGVQVGHRLAADLYQLFISQTFELAQNAAPDNIYVAYEPEKQLDELKKLIPLEFDYFPQHGKDLGKRMLNAFNYVLKQGSHKVIIMGSDSPTLPVQIVKDAFKRLDASDLVLGPAEDGGYYLIGIKKIHQDILENVQWSSSSVLQKTLEIALDLGLTYTLLPEWYDIDELENLQRAVNDDASGKIKTYLHQHTQILII
ncbi:MAG: TIGR04282 family arsenosugar biosynthesis glycosyltransferase [bacterium]